MESMEEEFRGSRLGGAVERVEGIGSMKEEGEEEGRGIVMFGSGRGRTVRIEDSEGGEVVERCEDLTTVVLYSDIVEPPSGR